MSNPISWVEIPVSDMARAIEFYNSVFSWTLASQMEGTVEIAKFPYDATFFGTSGALAYEAGTFTPSSTRGALISFTCTDCGITSEKAEKAGGRIIQPKTPISPLDPSLGFKAIICDSEGNRVAFVSLF